jgi:3-oxoacyl-[acyl-carrier protein] reductase
MELDLANRIALVTGGSRGIGRECSLGLARAGATVVINFSRSQEKAEELRRDLSREGFESDICRADISNPVEVRALFDFVRENYHRLDVLVNNAGITKDSLMLSMRLADWEKVCDVDLKGPFLASQMAVEMMLPNHRGKIINIASTSAIMGGKGQTNYAAAKGGLLSFTRACAVELAGKNIQVNAVLPGVIITEMSHRIRKKGGEAILKKIPASRFGEPSDVANLVVFLASDKADYITGQAIPVDGGLSVS